MGNPKPGDTCSFLGIKNDHSVCFSYPSPGNYCYKAKINGPVDQHHQNHYCISNNHIECDVFLADRISRLPKSIRSSKQTKPKLKYYYWAIATFVLITILFVNNGKYINLLSGLFKSNQDGFQEILFYTPDIEKNNVESSPIPSQNIENPTVVIIPTLIPSVIASDTPDPIETAYHGPAFSTAFGLNEQFVLHLIEEGDSLGIIARQYSTTNDVISKINDLIPGLPIWLGEVLVIIPGQQVMDGLEQFRAIQIEETLSISVLSARYGITVESLRTINGIGSAELIFVGSWIIIPITE